MASLISKASLLMVPSVYEDGTLYNVLPSGNKAPDETGNANGYDQTRADFTFSRGSNLAATRVNSDGLIEKGRENLLLQSNNFGTTWTESGSSGIISSGQSGYDGSSDAWQLEHKGSQYTSIRQTISTSGVQTYSVYAKAGTLDYIVLYAGTPRAWFDIKNGAVGFTSTVIDTSIEAVSGAEGWYRCSMVFNASATTARIYPNDASGTFGTATGTVFIQDAQLEKGLVATDYIETGSSTAQAGILEDMPRINYDANGENGALLLEPSRSNTLPYSEYLDAYAFARTDGTQNAATSPEGVNNAFKLFADTQTGAHYMRLNYTKTVGAVLSVFAKKGEETAFAIGNATGSQAVVFNLEDGTITSESGGTGTIEDYGSGWYRCSYYRTAWADWQYISLRGNFTSYTGDGSSGIYLYGLQFEDGTYMSSLIPTHGAAVTRGADDCSRTSIQSVIGQTEGTVFFEGKADHTPQNVSLLNFDRQTSFTVCFVKRNDDKVQAQVFNGGVSIIVLKTSAAVDGFFKMAFAYKSGDSVLYVNGSEVQTSSTTFTPAANVDDLYLGSYQSPYFAYDYPVDCKQAAIFKERLSDSELATLTTL